MIRSNNNKFQNFEEMKKELTPYELSMLKPIDDEDKNAEDKELVNSFIGHLYWKS